MKNRNKKAAGIVGDVFIIGGAACVIAGVYINNGLASALIIGGIMSIAMGFKAIK